MKFEKSKMCTSESKRNVYKIEQKSLKALIACADCAVVARLLTDIWVPGMCAVVIARCVQSCGPECAVVQSAFSETELSDSIVSDDCTWTNKPEKNVCN